MNKLISIVVPIYNVEKWLKKCIDSILEQTYIEFELILVDDGSPDNCGDICDRYSKLDKRITVIHKENGGLSSARNIGMKSAKGSYIFFVDSDDFVKPNMIETVVEKLDEYDPDILMFGYEMYLSKKKIVPMFKSGYIKEPKSIVINSDKPHSRNEFSFTWRYVFKNEFIRDKRLYFNEDIKVAEDTIFNMEAVFESKSMYVINEPLYIYNDSNTESIMRKKYKSDFHINLNIQYKEKVKLINKYNITNKIFLDDLYHYYIYNLIQICIENICIGPKERRKKEIKELLHLEMSKDSFNYFNIKELYKIADNNIFYVFLCMCKFKNHFGVYLFCKKFYII